MAQDTIDSKFAWAQIPHPCGAAFGRLRRYAPFERAREISWVSHKKSLHKAGFLYGAPGTIRTCDPLVRSQVLYPAELRVRKTCPARPDEGRVL